MRTSVDPTSWSHIYLSSNFWEGLWIIQQPVAAEIARTSPVLYVERFVSVFTVLRYPSLWRRLFTWMRGARRVSSRLRLLAPIPLFHLGHRIPWLFRAEFVLQRWWIERWARNEPSGPRILWMDNPLYECAVGRFDEALSVYHVADEIGAFPTSNEWVTGKLERAMLRKVDVVFAAAEQLSQDKRRWHRETHTVWNAIDTSVFGPEASAPTTVDAIPLPRVAFVGVVDEWVDLDLVYLAANRLPHIHFAVIGPIKISVDRLRLSPNVHFLGRLERMVIPSALRRCSASLVPFHKTKLTARIVPLKVFEALAAGVIPVCTDFSVDLATLEREGYARVARTPEEFVKAIEAAVAADSATQRASLAAYGRQQTWDARWRQMAKVLEELL